MQARLDELARMRDLVSGGNLPGDAAALIAQIRDLANPSRPAAAIAPPGPAAVPAPASTAASPKAAPPMAAPPEKAVSDNALPAGISVFAADAPAAAAHRPAAPPRPAP